MKTCLLKFGLSLIVAAACVAAGAKTVCLFDGRMPGQDAAANLKLSQTLERRGFTVERLDVDAFCARLVQTPPDAFVLPNCASVSRGIASAAVRAVQSGIPGVFLGGPLLDDALLRIGTNWTTRAEIAARRRNSPIGFRPPVLGSAFNASAWRRSKDRNAAPDSRIEKVGDGLHLVTGPMSGWDVFFTPYQSRFFGADEPLFGFTAKAENAETTVSFELIETDGSRWIATARLETEWTRHTLAPSDFRYWKDSQAKGRGGPGDALNPQRAQCLGIGVSSSHTPSMAGRCASVYFREIGSCRDPIAGRILEDSKKGNEVPFQDGVYPRYKMQRVANRICAIPRTLGEGCTGSQIWRFLPLKSVADSTTGGTGAVEWLLLERRPGRPERALAGFGYCDSAEWSAPAVLERVAATLERLVSGTTLFAAGADQRVYFPGETVHYGATWRGPARRARLVVKNAAGRILEQASLANGERLSRPVPAIGVYTVEVQLDSDVIVSDFAVQSPAPDPAEEFITVKGGDFYLKGKKWYAVGVNFWPLYIAGMNHEDYWSGWMGNEYYSPALVERDLAHFADMGGTMISIQSPPLGHERNLLDVLRRCRAHGLHVNLFVGSASPLDFQKEKLATYLEAAHLAGNATLFAYDTIWEPGNHVFRNDAARARWDGDWRTWIVDNYGSIAQAEKAWGFSARRNAKGEVIGPHDKWFVEDGNWNLMMADYRRFMDNMTSRAWNRATRELRKLDPNHLVSFRQGNTLPYDFALTGPVRHIDFICPEGYAVPHSDAGEDAIGWITRYVDATTGGKPIVWSEFGKSIWNAERMESEDRLASVQSSYGERFYRTALQSGANGTVPWWWPGGYRVGERSDFGIVSPDGAERPSAQLIRTYAPRFRTPHAKPVPDDWMDFDRDAHAGGYCRAAFKEGAARWHSSREQGKMLGIRLAGTDQTSQTAARRFLDAEFDVCEIHRAGATLNVHAILGNVGMATWTASNVVLTARRPDGTCLSSAPLVGTVPRLGASAGFDLKIPAGGRVALRLEARQETGVVPFGEIRWLEGDVQ